MAKPPKAPRRTRNPAARAAFFARKAEIEAQLQAGKFMLTIYEELEFPGSYAQFTRYIARYLRAARPDHDVTVDSRPTPRPPAATAAPAEEGHARPASPAEAQTSERVPLTAPKKTQRVQWDPANIDPDQLF